MNETTLRRRGLLLGALGLAAGRGALAAAPEATARYPERPVRLIVPYAAGGGPDIQARLLGPVLGKQLGQAMVLENKVGAGGILAAEYVNQQPPDGYTLLLGSSTHVTQKLLQPSVKFDPQAFSHICRTGTSACLLVVGADSPLRSVDDLLEAARRDPGRLNYASGGIGSAAHLFAAAFLSAADVQATHVPYRGSVEIGLALIRGDAQFAFPVISTALPQVRDGKLRALAVTAGERDPALPQVPTLNEALRRQDLDLVSWSGIWGPPGLPDALVQRLFGAVRAAMQDAGLRAAYARDGTVPSVSESPAEFSRFIAQETTRYRTLIARNRISLP